jgi:hypothetical protein
VDAERFFRSGYAASLIGSGNPTLEGVKEKLERGAIVADVGSGLGASRVLMAKSYPKSRFFGFDYHDKSIETAKQRAKDAGVSDRIQFQTAKAKDYPGENYDLGTFFDCLHDMGDLSWSAPTSVAVSDKDRTWMIVEPSESDKTEDNLHPIGRAFYGASTLHARFAVAGGGPGLGAQAGEKKGSEK